VPRALVRSTVEAASRFAAGSAPAAVVPPKVAALVEGVTKAMFLSKLKVTVVLPVVLAAAVAGLGFVGGPAAGGDKPGTPPVNRSGSGDPGPKGEAADEPINHVWITRRSVQQELRLSEKQVKEIAEVRAGVARKHEAELKGAREAAAEGNYKRAREVQNAFQRAEREAFAEAAPRIVSGTALGRLRQIQRQAGGLHNLLRDPAVLKRLGVSDEQVKQIEGFLSEGLEAARQATAKRVAGREVLPPWGLGEAIAFERAAYAGSVKKAVGVLTGPQRRAWDDYVGEPFDFAASSN
jgi:hypothetical protein